MHQDPFEAAARCPQPATAERPAGNGPSRPGLRRILDDLLLVGVDWRAGSDPVARLTVPRAARAERLRALFVRTQARELLYLATCNRVEVAVVRCGHYGPDELRDRTLEVLLEERDRPRAAPLLRALRGEEALAHLAGVACGLESALLGEREIRGQLREAITEARRLALAGPDLERVVAAALRIASRVHRETELGAGKTSLAEVALELLEARLGQRPGAVALVGVGTMSERLARRLAGRFELYWANRTYHKVVAAAARVGARPLALDELRERPPRVQAIVLATSAEVPVLDRRSLDRFEGERPLLVDLSLPANVEPEDARALGFERLGIDEISAQAHRQLERRAAAAAAGRSVLAQAVSEESRGLLQRSLSPVLKTLAERYRATAGEAIEQLFVGELANLSAGERAALRRCAAALAKRLAHIPTLGLRALLLEEGEAAVVAFLRGADPSLLDALEARDDEPPR